MRLAASSRGLRGAAILRAASASQSNDSNQRWCFTSRALPCKDEEREGAKCN